LVSSKASRGFKFVSLQQQKNNPLHFEFNIDFIYPSNSAVSIKAKPFASLDEIKIISAGTKQLFFSRMISPT